MWFSPEKSASFRVLIGEFLDTTQFSSRFCREKRRRSSKTDPHDLFLLMIPRALMQEASVVAFIPCSSAAPPGPETFPFAWLMATRMLSDSNCL